MTFTDSSPRNDDEYVRTVSAISAAIARGDLRRAYEVADWAIGRGMKGRVIYNARALALQASGRIDEAILDFRHALEFAPNDPAIHNALGTSLSSQGRWLKAIEAFDASLALKNDDPIVHYRRGRALVGVDDNKGAMAAFERAVELNPKHVDALSNIASIAARSGDYEKASLFANRTLALAPADATAHHALSLVEMHDKKYADVEQRMRYLTLHHDVDPNTRGGMHSLLGDAVEAQGRHGEAFEIYTRGNDSLKSNNARRFEAGTGIDTISHITRYFEATSVERWKQPAPGGKPPGDVPDQHVFLLGFMRSGTTLLEQVMASNPKVVALEEVGSLSPLSEKYMRSNDGLDQLRDIAGADLDAARQTYWDRVREHAPDVRGKVLVDKQPFNTVRIPLIAKLFPDAKILFAIRDPRDVVFSCYRRPFAVNTTMVEFLDLVDGAKMYASIMALSEIYREKLTLNIFDHYYEDMVTNFEPRVRAVCDFVGLEWSDSMRDFNKRASVASIDSPSATQIRRPLYGEGIGQWRKYAEQLQPMMPVLRPWVERFGYSAE
ncbi:MAG TPA: sulfotransferase [Rhizomicrobium sp.]|nr:sulfotransferase [Rhizomicrobium sp.]